MGIKYNKAICGYTLDELTGMLDIKNVMVFHGPPGIGKSTVATLISEKFKEKHNAEVRIKGNMSVAQVREVLEEFSSIIYANDRKLLIIEETDKMDIVAINELIANTESLEPLPTGKVQINCILITNSLKIQNSKAIFSRCHWIDFKFLAKDYIKKYIGSHPLYQSIPKDTDKEALIGGIDYMINASELGGVDYRFLNAIIQSMVDLKLSFVDAVRISISNNNMTEEEREINNKKIFNSINGTVFPTEISVDLNAYKTLSDIMYLENYICKSLLNIAVKKNVPKDHLIYMTAVKSFSNLNSKLVSLSDSKVDARLICQMNKLSILDALFDIYTIKNTR